MTEQRLAEIRAAAEYRLDATLADRLRWAEELVAKQGRLLSEAAAEIERLKKEKNA